MYPLLKWTLGTALILLLVCLVSPVLVNASGSPGTGTITASGSEQSTSGSGATAGTGSATVSGSEQSSSSGSPTAGTGIISISGYEQSYQYVNPDTLNAVRRF